MKKAGLMLGLLLLCSFGVALAAPPAALDAEGTVWVFQKDAEGRIHLVEVRPGDAEPIDGDFVVPGTACNGGTCSTPAGASVSCPTTGTLRCKVGQDCLCKCHKDVNGSWYGKNECV